MTRICVNSLIFLKKLVILSAVSTTENFISMGSSAPGWVCPAPLPTSSAPMVQTIGKTHTHIVLQANQDLIDDLVWLNSGNSGFRLIWTLYDYRLKVETI